MKIIAYYLPQFHRVKENDIWWGENFTEWVNTKKMTPLFKGHEQPRVPLDENYYNLMHRETVEWQTKLAKDFNVYGFCYYHYWFSGRKLLEKPCENLLNWTDIKQNFCFCWANHNWVKSNNGIKEVLMEQTYGMFQEWEEHFQYLIQFFKDDRYIKIDNKPIFVIYDINSLQMNEERIAYYDKRCKENGLNGIYVIESLNTNKSIKSCENSSAAVIREPAVAFTGVTPIERIINIVKRRILKVPVNYNYKKISKRILKTSKMNMKNENVIFGTFTDWDNTSRHGKGGSYISNKNVDDFKKFLRLQKDLMRESNREFIFMNAWNEWAEGMYMEPDNKYGTAYLQAIKEVVSE